MNADCLDDGMMWSMQDTAPLNEIDWTIFGISPQASMELGFAENALPAISVPPSRPPSPPIDQTEEDKWRKLQGCPASGYWKLT